MATLRRWFLWVAVALSSLPTLWMLTGQSAFRLPGQRGLEENPWVAVPVFLLVLLSALTLTLQRWRTLPNCFILGGALAASGVALVLNVGSGGGLLLVACANALVQEGRRQLDALPKGETRSGA